MVKMIKTDDTQHQAEDRKEKKKKTNGNVGVIDGARLRSHWVSCQYYFLRCQRRRRSSRQPPWESILPSRNDQRTARGRSRSLRHDRSTSVHSNWMPFRLVLCWFVGSAEFYFLLLWKFNMKTCCCKMYRGRCNILYIFMRSTVENKGSFFFRLTIPNLFLSLQRFVYPKGFKSSNYLNIGKKNTSHGISFSCIVVCPGWHN